MYNDNSITLASGVATIMEVYEMLQEVLFHSGCHQLFLVFLGKTM